MKSIKLLLAFLEDYQKMTRDDQEICNKIMMMRFPIFTIGGPKKTQVISTNTPKKEEKKYNRRRHKYGTLKQVCMNCGKVFKTYNKKAKYCSYKCMGEHRRGTSKKKRGNI